ncbi:uncharacterized protein LOC113461644 isoform X2 [Phoenix dactylifera]|uniref:Uncharacterized protein LOC113461644 isoform X2 n=1 Tax=Phoenix dactylifera TaxID=42345 RepID=A0A8B9A4Z6_PHODC|nr:uncharacterized protein LOC113461644 isoform X2 [Phoenix dactylifera]
MCRIVVFVRSGVISLEMVPSIIRKGISQQPPPPYFQPLQEGMCSVLTGHEMYQPPLEEEQMGGGGIPGLKNWVTRSFGAGNNGLGEEGGVGSGGPLGAMGYGDLQRSIDTFGQRTSQYRGVTRHRWTGRYEAHLWDNSCKKEGQTRKGRQVYLGGYDMEEKAARAYDLAALKYWGPSTHINFPLEDYQQELEEMKNMSRQEYVAHLRRKSSGFSRGASMYRGVTRHHQHGRWQARIGRVSGNKDLYLGTFSKFLRLEVQPLCCTQSKMLKFQRSCRRMWLLAMTLVLCIRHRWIVPPTYPVDQDLIKLCLLDHLMRLGCGDHFTKEMADAMDHIYRNWGTEELQLSKMHNLPLQIFRDSLAFQLLRRHGHRISPERFCWFMRDPQILLHIEENYQDFLGAMYTVYRATHLMFIEELELENAKTFSKKILQQGLPSEDLKDSLWALSDLQKEIEHELKNLWLARMDHLEHRMYIERSKDYNLWIGKSSSCRLTCLDDIIQLATKNFMTRQSVYRTELEELKRWSKDIGLANMGFGRENNKLLLPCFHSHFLSFRF